MIRITDLSKSFGGRPILDGLSLTLPDRGIVALRGPSGCGKTTLFRLIAGLEAPDAGRIEGVYGKRISIVFQEDRLLPWRTARENIALVSPDRGDIDPLLESLGLAGEGDKLPHELSGGMRRRIAVGRALHHAGDLYLLDEPFGGLDPDTKERIMAPFLELGQEHLILLITHDEGEAERLADHILTVDGPPLHLLSQ